MTLEQITLTGGQEIMAHAADNCIVTPCTIHAPSMHHMIEWRLIWRDDRKIFERICEHGVGHPDPDTIFDHGGGVHGCDGCCSP